MKPIERTLIHVASILGATSCTLSLFSTICPVIAVPAAVCSVAQTAITAFALKKIYSQEQSKKRMLLLAGGLVLSTVGAALSICNVLQSQGLILSSTEASLDITATTVSETTTEAMLTTLEPVETSVCDWLVGCDASYILGLTAAAATGASLLLSEFYLFVSRNKKLWISTPSTEPAENKQEFELTEVTTTTPIDKNKEKKLIALRKQVANLQCELLKLMACHSTGDTDITKILELLEKVKALQTKIALLLSKHPELKSCCKTFNTAIGCQGNLLEYLLGEFLFTSKALDLVTAELNNACSNLTTEQLQLLQSLKHSLEHRLNTLKVKILSTLRHSNVTTLTAADELLVLIELISWLQDQLEDKEDANLDPYGDEVSLLKHYIEETEEKIAALTV